MSTPAHRLRRRIRERGPIPFAEFMEEALYGPGGYYTRQELPIGPEGDYVTGSSFSPLFGRATARLIRGLDLALGRPAGYLEAGYGSGAHLEAVVAALGKDPQRQLWAWDRVARPVPEGVERLERLEDVRERTIHGLLFSYELFDALPVHRLIWRQTGELGELWVGLGEEEEEFVWQIGELSDPSLERLLPEGAESLQVGQIADLAPGWAPLYRRLARCLGTGLLVTCDYGFPVERLLDPRIRRHGTLACYRHQTVHRNPFAVPGEEDLTAHVDFTTLIRAGEEEGLVTVTLTRQALWLAACGLFEDLQGASWDVREEAMALLNPEGMGEEIRVLVQTRGVDAGEVLDLEVLAAG